MSDELTFTPKNRKDWRRWLEQNGAKETSVWLIYYKATSGKPTITYSDAVDEALCFGWIDSKVQTVDAVSYRQFFTKRKPDSVWSKLNKAKVEKLIEQELMTEAGLRCIKSAQQNGYWSLLDDAENGIIPPDLEKALNRSVKARKYFDGLSRTDKRNLLQWLVLAKKEENRKKRINAIIDNAIEGKKPKGF